MYYMCIVAICVGALRKHLGLNFLLTQMCRLFPLIHLWHKKRGFPAFKNVTNEIKTLFSFPFVVVDTNDRFLRKITVGQASTEKGQSREVCGSRSALMLFIWVFVAMSVYIKHLEAQFCI